jgi:hypothetical protein
VDIYHSNAKIQQMSKEQVKNAKIKVSKEFIPILASENGCNKMTVYNSLSYHNNSILAEAIRASAKKLLEAEAKKIK